MDNVGIGGFSDESLLGGEEETGFAAGAIYAVFPACNNALFWSVSTWFYYFQALALVWWFHGVWKKLAIEEDFRYRWKDFARLLPVVFSGEQVLPALLFLLPVTDGLFGKRQNRRRFLRFWAAHAATRRRCCRWRWPTRSA